MKKTIGLVCGFLACAVTAPADAATRYRLEFTIARDGVVVSKPSLVVEEGKRAELTLENAGDPDRGIRMLATAVPATAGTPEREAASLDLMFFESHGGEWILRSEPSTTVYLDEPASLEIATRNGKRAAPTFDITYRIGKANDDAPR